MLTTSYNKLQHCPNRCVAQLVSALPSVLEVPSSILSDSSLCFDFPLIYVQARRNEIDIGGAASIDVDIVWMLQSVLISKML